MWTLLFATDGSDDAAAATDLLALLPFPEGTTLRVLHVAPPPTHSFQEGWRAYGLLESTERERAEGLVAQTCERLSRPGVLVEGQALVGEPAAEIIENAGRYAADLVVVGSRGLTGLRGFFLGSVARNVAQHAPCSVLVARAPRHGLRAALVATDGSEHAARALALAGRLPLPAQTALTVVNVVRPYRPIPTTLPVDVMALNDAVLDIRAQQTAEAQALATEAAEQLRAAGRPAAEVVRTGDPAEEICALAEQSEADLIIAGARGVSPIESLLLGSVADRLLKRAPCSVIVAR